MSRSDDSSDEELSTTSVLLGYASKEPTGDEISYLGGAPTWLGDIKPPYDLVQCKVCKNTLSQLLQLNGELPEHFPTHDRRIHILACRKKACARKPGSIRALRAVRHSSTVPEKILQPAARSQAKTNLGNDIFGGPSTASIGANPFAKSSATSPGTNLFSISAGGNSFSNTAAAHHTSSTSITRTPVPWPEGVVSNDFPKLYLDAEYESCESPKGSIGSSYKTTGSLQDDTVDTNERAQEDSETFESSLDKVFQKFADRLAQNPEQILRYEFGGRPLLSSATDDVGKIFHHDSSSKITTAKRSIPGCNNCSKPRTSEVQLTPHAILELESDDLSLDGMEWVTIIVGVCEADCQARAVSEGDVGYLEEWTGVQWEERRR